MSRTLVGRASAPAIVILALVIGGCGAKNKPSSAGETGGREAVVHPVVEKVLPDGLVLVEVDTNKDRQPDIFSYYMERRAAPRLLVRKELDLNRDGRVDTITYFDDEGRIEREEMDRDFDGQFDWTDHYQNAVRVMSEVDQNKDGRMDVFSYYEGNPPRITRKERDTNGDTLIDYWERFDERGAVTKTGRDIDGDGKMDERDE